MSVHIPRGAPRAAAAALMALAVLILPLRAGAQSAAAPEWSTYIGGGDRDRIMAITQNSNRDITVVGRTLSIDFATPPTPGAQSFSQIFLAGFDRDGFPIPQFPLRMFGGPGADDATAVALAPDNSVYIVGQTSSSAMTNAGDKVGTWKEDADAFLIRFTPQGNPDWYMYLGGTGSDAATGVTVIGNSVYVCGTTSSNNFLNITSSSNPAPDSVNAFVVRVDIDPTTFDPTIGWSLQPRIIGGSGDDRFMGITPGPNGTLLAAGTTTSSTETLGNVYSTLLNNAFKGGDSDAFVVALSEDSGEPLWLTYVGGNGKDEGRGIAAGANRTAFVVAGTTTSTDIAGAATPTGTNAFGAWVTKEGWTRLTQLRGGTADEEVLAVTTDSNGTAYIGGRTSSPSFPRGSLGFDTQIEAPGATPLREGFVWMLPGWGGPGWDSFAGGDQVDEVSALVVQTATQLIVGMMTSSSMGLPGDRTNRDTSLNGASDGYLLAVKINQPNPPLAGMVVDRPQADSSLDDIDTTPSKDSLFASWEEFINIPGGAITSGYEWAIGTPQNQTSIRNFGPTDMPLRSSATQLDLQVGQRYIVTVRAANAVGLTQGAQSNGVLVTLPDGGLGEPDAGPRGPDGGMGTPDGGMDPPDAGMDPPDSGPEGPDGPNGGAGNGNEDGKVTPLGWGCASAGGMAVPLFLGLIALVILSRRMGQSSR